MRLRIFRTLRLTDGRLTRVGELVDADQVLEAFRRWTVPEIDRAIFARGAPAWFFERAPRLEALKEPLQVEKGYAEADSDI